MFRFYFIFICRRSVNLAVLFFLVQLGVSSFAQVDSGGGILNRSATLQEYRDNIKHVKDDLSSMYSLAEKDFDADWSKRDQLDFEKKFFAEVPTLLPPRETIEWQGAEVEVDNRWLHKGLEDMKKLPQFDSPERNRIVNDLSGRLEALDARLAGLMGVLPSDRNKDEEKQKLAQILKRAEYQAAEKKEKSAIERWWEAFWKSLKGLFPDPEPVAPVDPISGPAMAAPGIVQALIVGIAVAVIAFVIWRFAPVFRNRRRRRKDKKDDNDRIILGERLGANESSATLFEQAEMMAQAGNFRGAIRKGYIAMLCELGDRKIVRLAQNKTNRDYLRDVSKNRELHNGVRELTSIFEDHWYGLASASEDDWGVFRENYRYSTGKL
jgi:DNA primase